MRPAQVCNDSRVEYTHVWSYRLEVSAHLGDKFGSTYGKNERSDLKGDAIVRVLGISKCNE